MRKALLPLLAMTSMIFASEEFSYESYKAYDFPEKPQILHGYVSIDVNSVADRNPSLRLGVRMQESPVGFDLGAFGGAGVEDSHVGGYGSILYTFNPEAKISYYGGLGGKLEVDKRKSVYRARHKEIVPLVIRQNTNGVLSLGATFLTKGVRRFFLQVDGNWPHVGNKKIHRNVEKVDKETGEKSVKREIKVKPFFRTYFDTVVLYGMFF